MTSPTAVTTRRAIDTLLAIDLELVRADAVAQAPAALAWLEEDFTRKQSLLALCPCGCEDPDTQTGCERQALQASVFARPIVEEGSAPGECITDEGDGECFCEVWWISDAPGDCRDEGASAYRPQCQRRPQQLTVTGVSGAMADYLNEQLGLITPEQISQWYHQAASRVLYGSTAEAQEPASAPMWWADQDCVELHDTQPAFPRHYLTTTARDGQS